MFWIRGDPYDVHVLKKANALKAKIAYIFLEKDSDTILTCLSLERLTNSKIVTVVKYNSKENIEHLKSIGVDFLFNPDEIEVPLMVSSLLDYGAGEWAMSLISKAKETPNVYNMKASQDDIGKTWSEIVSAYLKHHQIHPVAIVRGKEIIYNPELNEVMQGGESYLVISEKRPTISTVS